MHTIRVQIVRAHPAWQPCPRNPARKACRWAPVLPGAGAAFSTTTRKGFAAAGWLAGPRYNAAAAAADPQGRPPPIAVAVPGACLAMLPSAARRRRRRCSAWSCVSGRSPARRLSCSSLLHSTCAALLNYALKSCKLGGELYLVCTVLYYTIFSLDEPISAALTFP